MHTYLINQFLIKWVSITTLGWLGAQVIGIFITRAAFPTAELTALPTSPFYFGVFGLLFGLSQWICLRDRVPNSFGWVVATAMGCFVAALLLKLLNRSELINSFLREFHLLAYFLGGVVMGFAQHQVIKKTVQRTRWWTITVGISWVIAQVFIAVDSTAIDFLGILVFATITGVVFAWLVQNPPFEIQHA